MGFCYPERGKMGDLPPRPECQPKWHPHIFEAINNIRLTLLIGAHAKRAYLGENFNMDLTETVRGYHSYFPKYFPISHPSPTNRFWMAKNR